MQLPPHDRIELGETERVVFFSDAHLSGFDTPENRLKTDRVCAFLELLPGNTDTVVILGDLFDFYFEYRTVLPARHMRVLSALQRLTRAGVRCCYAAGNHDFWLGDLFTSTLGVEVAKNAWLFERPGCRVLAAHGDGLGEGDTGYKMLKALLRNRLLISMFRLIHPDWGYKVADLTSRTSRKHTARRQDARIEASADTGRTLLESRDDLDAVILAHTHQPDDRSYDSGRYLNTGDWCSHFTWIDWPEGKLFRIREFDGEKL